MRKHLPQTKIHSQDQDSLGAVPCWPPGLRPGFSLGGLERPFTSWTRADLAPRGTPTRPGSPRRPHTQHRGQAPAFPLVTEVAAAPAPLGTSAVMLWPRVHHPLSLQRPPMSTPRPLCGAPLVDTPQIPASAAAGPSTLGPRSLSRLCGRARPCLWEAPPWGPRRAEPPRAPAPPPRGPGLVPFCHVLSPHSCGVNVRSLARSDS